MKFVEGNKVDLTVEMAFMKEQCFKYRLWLETEDESGMRFRNDYYFKTKEEMEKFLDDFKRKLGDNEYFSDIEIVDLEKGELI